MKFAANLSLLWPELPFLDRFDAAAAAGFDAVEVLFPYDMAAPEILSAMRRSTMRMVLINAPPPNYTGGLRGFAARPDGTDRFRYDMKRVFRYAEALGAGLIHVMAGEAEGEDAFDTMVANLKWASRQAPKGVTLTIEPLNGKDMPGYFLNSYPLAAKVLDAVKKPNVRLQYDTYHAQVIHGDAVDIWKRYGLRAAHVQLGDAPGRVAPGDGQINFSAFFNAMRETGYDGWISAEYKPGSRQTEDSLGWFKKLRVS
ncbi:hydroxypyruvate isomerase [Aliishimia ponticola]|uniref:Hydroxypyruvate isomerase n=1 Tax=Aliishimia ponticola TaxID=2499833 RepID=A0A4S4N6Y5_9RHOB|nr:TIM barrel protein [Aliishimia ponticola]THH34829.1 hydroxypyruvate isomerase [Aliishimia ponticola]